MKKYAPRILLLLFSLLVAAFITEGILRVYNPFGFVVKGTRIDLPKSVTRKTGNNHISKLDSVITYTYNNIGFRGKDYTEAENGKCRILAIGGSTTACRLLSDGEDWPTIVANNIDHSCANTWMNNAGVDGFSTLGCSLMVQQTAKTVKPQVVLFLVGRNEMGKQGLGFEEFKKVIEQAEHGGNIFDHSELICLIRNLSSSKRSNDLDFRHFDFDLSKAGSLMLADSVIEKNVDEQKQAYIADYKNRLAYLVQLCKRQNILPVLITQPCLVGTGIDSITKVDLATVKISDKENGLLFAASLNLYNQATLEVAASNSISTIDLATALPKNSQYYYDYIHYTKAGSAAVASIVSPRLTTILAAANYCK